MRGYVRYAVVALVLILVAAWLLTLAFHAPGDAAAVWLSAIVAAAVQLAAFEPVRRLARRQMIAGWGVGVLVRFVTLVVYALLVLKVLAVAAAPALVALAAFLFLTTLIEPLFLGR